MISPVRSSVAPATRSAPLSGKHGFARAVFVVCWALSAAACCAVAFDPLVSPVRSGSPGPPPDLPALLVPAWPVTGVLYAFLWVSLPVLLLFAGAGLIRFAVPGRRWHVAWTGAAAAGIALDLLGLLALNQFDSHPRYWLGLGLGFAILGTTTLCVSARAPRPARRVHSLDGPPSGASAPRRAGAARGSAARRGRIAALVIGGSALLIGIAAIAVVLTRSSRPALSLTGGGGSVSSVAFSPDGTMLAVAHEGGGIHLWNAVTGRPLARLAGAARRGGVDSMAFSPDGQTLAIGEGDGHTYLWNVAAGALTATMRNPGSVVAVAFSPDGRILATDDAGPGTYLWNLAAGTRTALPSEGDFDGLGSLAFSPDGRTLAVAEGDAYSGSASLWGIATGKLIASFSDPSGYAISSVAFSPDGKALAGGDTYDADQPAAIPARTYVWDVGGLP